MARQLKRFDVPGSDHGSIGAYERGARTPSPEYLRAVVELAGVSGHWLLTGAEPMILPPEGREQHAFRRIARYIEAVRRAGDADVTAAKSAAQTSISADDPNVQDPAV